MQIAPYIFHFTAIHLHNINMIMNHDYLFTDIEHRNESENSEKADSQLFRWQIRDKREDRSSF